MCVCVFKLYAGAHYAPFVQIWARGSKSNKIPVIPTRRICPRAPQAVESYSPDHRQRTRLDLSVINVLSGGTSALACLREIPHWMPREKEQGSHTGRRMRLAREVDPGIGQGADLGERGAQFRFE